MLVEQPDAALALANVGSVDQNPKYKSIGVNDELSLATLDIFFPRRNHYRRLLLWS